MSKRNEGWPHMLPDSLKTSVARYFCRFASIASASLLVACSQPVAAPAVQNTPSVTKAVVVPANADKAVRAIVKFRQIVAYRDPAFVQSLSQQIQARVSYVSSISEDTHVYLIEPLAVHDTAGAFRRLGSVPTVLWVELDRKVTPF